MPASLARARRIFTSLSASTGVAGRLTDDRPGMIGQQQTEVTGREDDALSLRPLPEPVGGVDGIDVVFADAC